MNKHKAHTVHNQPITKYYRSHGGQGVGSIALPTPWIFTAICACILAGCAITAPIQSTASSRSGFEGSLYKGTTIKVHEPIAGQESYRVFQQGATGFVPIQTVRDEAEGRAIDFCKRTNGGVMQAWEETTAKAPFVPGNLPRIEIVFACVPAPAPTAAVSHGPKYSQLLNLKKLLDAGIITQTEFTAEKGKILNQP